MALLLTAPLGCGGERTLGLADGGPGGGRGGVVNPLVGEWEVSLFVEVVGDVQLWTTNWVFNDGGTCRFRRTVVSVVGGTTVRLNDCVWTTANGALRATTVPEGTVLVEAQFSFPGGATDRLILQGIEYRRIR